MSKLFELASDGMVDNKYARTLQVPQYLPSQKKPELEVLTTLDKYTELIRNINASNVPDEEKAFLKLAATRHIIFNYAKVADYYAHSNKEMQSLMEQSALVIIDIEDAIANGYVKLSKNIKKLMEESGEVENG